MIAIKRIVTLLLTLQAIATVFLGSLNSVVPAQEGRFAVFLAIDLLAFAMVTYVYTHNKWGENVARTWILAGSAGLVILLLSSLFLA